MWSKITGQIKKIIFYNFNVFDYRGKNAIRKVENITFKQENTVDKSTHTVGIVKEAWHLHSHYINACNELGISYVVIDLFAENWYEQIQKAKLDYLIFRPSVQYSPWKDMFDNRMYLLKESQDISIYPDFNSLWLWENKLRTLDWLKVNGLPHPESFIFYNRKEALKFGENCDYPIVYKSSSGSGASGVKIINNYWQFKSVVNKVFKSGIRTYRKHKLDKEHGSVIFQKFIEDVREWRIIRIGDYFFGFEKLKDGDFHSGSKKFDYGNPPEKCLDFVREITNKYSFHFVDIDLFVNTEGELFVNEIQPYFGQQDDRELLVINNSSGRLYFDEYKEKWIFEQGVFCQNNLCNLRLSEMIKMTEIEICEGLNA